MDIMSKFNLPKYLKGKSFSEASKCISDKFKDRNSPEDIETMNEMQGRLKQAQEFVKSEQEARTRPQAATADDFVPGEQNTGAGAPAPEQAPGQNGYALGGLLEMAGGAQGLAEGAMGMASGMFGGQTGSTVSGALDGASKGSQFGPWGAAIGAGIGGITGFLDGGASEDEFDKQQRIETNTTHNKASNAYKTGGQLLANSFRTGDDLDPPTGPPLAIEEKSYPTNEWWNKTRVSPGPGQAPAVAPQEAATSPTNSTEPLNKWWDTTKTFNPDPTEPKVAPGMEKGQGNFMKPIPEEGNSQWWKKNPFPKNPVNPLRTAYNTNPASPVSTSTTTNTIDTKTPLASQVNTRDKVKGLSALPTIGVQESIDLDRNLMERRNPDNDKGLSDNNDSNNSFDLAEMLRYAPAAMNMGQLANMKKPEPIALDRLGNRYNEQRVDERGLQNSVRESVDNNRDAILSSSGGSGSAARRNLIASQLQGSKAMSNAYQSATGENRQEARNAQKFNLGIDQANIAQANNETNLNLEQRAAYQTNKSKLLSQLGNDLGGVGTEEMFKKYPELMGMNYNWKGKHKGKKKSGSKTA